MENVFTREKKPFQMLGTEYFFEFIPSIYFQEILAQLLDIWTKVDIEDGKPVIGSEEDRQSVLNQLSQLFKERIYQILFDVLKYQNNSVLDMETLKRKTSVLEIVEFTVLVATDKEITKAVEVLINGLGKLMPKTATQLQTPNSMPSSSQNLDSSPTT